MYEAVNKGLRLAHGTVLAYLNSDDVYFPWTVASAVSTMRGRAADLVFGDLVALVKSTGRPTNVRLQFYSDFDPRIYAYEVSLAQPTVFWNREVTHALGGFDERLRFAGDYEYWLRAAVAGFRYAHVGDVLALSMEHEATLSTLNADKLRDEIERVRTWYSGRIRRRRPAHVARTVKLLHWRRAALNFRRNLMQPRPAKWAGFIDFLRETSLAIAGSSVVYLLLPVPLPRSWTLLRLDARVFESRVVAALATQSTAS
jgi:hypothetical protein